MYVPIVPLLQNMQQTDALGGSDLGSTTGFRDSRHHAVSPWKCSDMWSFISATRLRLYVSESTCQQNKLFSSYRKGAVSVGDLLIESKWKETYAPTGPDREHNNETFSPSHCAAHCASVILSRHGAEERPMPFLFLMFWSLPLAIVYIRNITFTSIYRVHQSGKHNILGSFYLNFHHLEFQGLVWWWRLVRGHSLPALGGQRASAFRTHWRNAFTKSFHCLNDPLMGMT